MLVSVLTEMTRDVSTALSDEVLALFGRAHESDKSSLIEDIFKGLDSDDIEILLADFCTSDPRETYSGFDCVEEVSWTTPTSGTIRVIFNGHSFYGCRDMDKEFEHGAAVLFMVNLAKKEILFTSHIPDLPERDTVNEF